MRILFQDLLCFLQRKLEQEQENLGLWYAVSFFYGILFYFSLENEPSLKYIGFSLSSIVIIAIFIFKFFYNFIWKFVLLIFIAFDLGIFLSTYRTSTLQPIAINSRLYNADIIGNVESLRPTPYGVQIVLNNLQIPQLSFQSIPNKIRLHSYSDSSNILLSGDVIKTKSHLSPPPQALIPRGYNFRQNAFFKEIGAVGRITDEIEILNYRDTSLNSLTLVRKKIYNLLIKQLGIQNGNFAAAIFLGEGGGIEQTVLNNMRYAGISHVLCVSGLHLSLVAMLFFISSRFILNIVEPVALRFDIKKLAAYFSLIGSFSYLLLTGVQIAATRAFIMTSVAIWAIIIARTPYPMRSLVLAAILILIFNPEYAINPSFQLSFMAVISLISGYEFYLKHSFILGDSKGVIASFRLYLISNIYSCLVASLATAPIVIYHFYIFSNYSILANLVAVPLISFIIMPVGILAISFSFCFLGDWLFSILNYSINLMQYLADFVVNLPYSVLYMGSISALSVTIFLFSYLWLAFWQTSWRLYGIGGIILSMILMVYPSKPAVIVNFSYPYIALKDTDGVKIYGNKISKFGQNFIANWYGYKAANYYNQKLLRQQNLSYDRNVAKISNYIIKNNNDMVINFKDFTIESGAYLQQFNKDSTIFIYPVEQKIVSHESSKRFNFITDN